MGLVETAEHREQPIPVRKHAAPLDVGVLVEPAEALLHRCRTHGLGKDLLDPRPIDPEPIVRPSRMHGDPLRRSGDVRLGAGVDRLGDQKRATTRQ